jgi:hypothetical protein
MFRGRQERFQIWNDVDEGRQWKKVWKRVRALRFKLFWATLCSDEIDIWLPTPFNPMDEESSDEDVDADTAVKDEGDPLAPETMALT